MAKVRRRRLVAAASSLPTIAELVRATAARLRKANVIFAHGTNDPVAEAAFIVGETLKVHPDCVAALAGRRVTAAQQKAVERLAAQRVETRQPAAYLLKRIYMRGVAFYIDERAIVPRSYLGEILGESFRSGFSLAGDLAKIRRILDLCTGSGCLAVLAAMQFPKAKVDAVDISADALKIARRNVADHGAGDRIKLFHGDLFAPLKSARYDLIMANPPYVDAKGMAKLPPECRYEPRLALDGGSDGLAVIRRILDQAGRHLTPAGGLLCEVGRGKAAIERAYPRLRFLWLDTEESEGEVFWIDARQLTAVIPGHAP